MSLFLRPGQKLPENAELLAQFSGKKVLLFAGAALLLIVLFRRRGAGVQVAAGYRVPAAFGTIDSSGSSDANTYRRNMFSGLISGLGVASTRTPLSQFPPAASTLAPTTAQAQALGYGTAPAGQQAYGTQVG